MYVKPHKRQNALLGETHQSQEDRGTAEAFKIHSLRGFPQNPEKEIPYHFRLISENLLRELF